MPRPWIELTTSRSPWRQHDQGVLRANHSATAAVGDLISFVVMGIDPSVDDLEDDLLVVSFEFDAEIHRQLSCMVSCLGLPHVGNLRSTLIGVNKLTEWFRH